MALLRSNTPFPLVSRVLNPLTIRHSQYAPSVCPLQSFHGKSARTKTTTTIAQQRNLHTKVVASAEEALTGLPLCGATVAIGGFGLCGIPETLISSLANNSDAQSLTTVALTAGVDGFGMGKLFETPGKVKRMISSYVGENKVRLLFSDIVFVHFYYNYNASKEFRIHVPEWKLGSRISS